MENIDLIKHASLDYQVHQLIASRWSPRAYDKRQVESEKLQRIFEAARWAASSSNQQPWHFLVGFNGDEVFKKIFAALDEFNQLWVVNVPVLTLAIAKITNSRGEPNTSFAYDLGQSVAILSLQAMAEGIYTHQMGGIDTIEVARSFEIPTEFKVLTAFTLGYLGDVENLYPKFVKMEISPRVRRPSTEFVFTGSFGHRADFL